MSTIHVELGDRSYPIVVEPGLRRQVAERILQLSSFTSVLVVTHPGLANAYAQPIADGLSRHGVPTRLLTLPPGERLKNLKAVERLYDAMLDAGLDRKSLLVTVGGGVLGDVGGFAAASYLRGISFVQVPTTLLAQVDASVGGKTGVDLARGKNLVGAFHQPRAVFIDTDTLKTLPLRELRAGLAEVIKYGIITDRALFARLLAQMPRLLRRDPEALTHAIVRSCEIKAEVVCQDETEQGLRAVLNFGHTVGHALEAITGYRRYKHGEAIAIGMVSAALIGEEVGVTSPGVTAEILQALKSAKLPTAFPGDIETELILEAMMRDKKRVGSAITFILARKIGLVELNPNVTSDAVRSALSRQRGLNDAYSVPPLNVRKS
jgi:3-dehydroquinate synthase